MNKKYKILIILCVIVIIFSALSIIYILNNDNKYDINKPTAEYKFTTKEETYDYYKFLVSKMEPKELQKYDDESKYSLSDYTINNKLLIVHKHDGKYIIEQIKKFCYINFINNYLFNVPISSDMPLSKKFLKKFKNGILEYYGMDKNNRIEVYKLDQEKQYIHVLEKKVVAVKEDGDEELYGVGSYEFHYILDKKGYIDDLVLINKK